MFCWSLFVLLYFIFFGHCVVCSSSIYGFWLPPFGIFKLFLSLQCILYCTYLSRSRMEPVVLNFGSIWCCYWIIEAVVVVIVSYCSWIYNYMCNQCLSPLTLWVRIPLRRGVFDTTLFGKVCKRFAAGLWFFDWQMSMVFSVFNKLRWKIVVILLILVELGAILS